MFIFQVEKFNCSPERGLGGWAGEGDCDRFPSDQHDAIQHPQGCPHWWLTSCESCQLGLVCSFLLWNLIFISLRSCLSLFFLFSANSSTYSSVLTEKRRERAGGKKGALKVTLHCSTCLPAKPLCSGSGLLEVAWKVRGEIWFPLIC